MYASTNAVNDAWARHQRDEMASQVKGKTKHLELLDGHGIVVLDRREDLVVGGHIFLLREWTGIGEGSARYQ